MRPGRFDKLLYVGPCTTADEKIAVLDAQMKRYIFYPQSYFSTSFKFDFSGRFTLDKTLTKKAIADMLHSDMTGADLYSICSNAWLSAVRRTIQKYIHGECERFPFFFTSHVLERAQQPVFYMDIS